MIWYLHGESLLGFFAKRTIQTKSYSPYSFFASLFIVLQLMVVVFLPGECELKIFDLAFHVVFLPENHGFYQI